MMRAILAKKKKRQAKKTKTSANVGYEAQVGQMADTPCVFILSNRQTREYSTVATVANN